MIYAMELLIMRLKLAIDYSTQHKFIEMKNQSENH
jgi:hypothetical protein